MLHIWLKAESATSWDIREELCLRWSERCENEKPGSTIYSLITGSESLCNTLRDDWKWLPVSLYSLCTEAWRSSQLPAPGCVDEDEWRCFLHSMCEVLLPHKQRKSVYESQMGSQSTAESCQVASCTVADQYSIMQPKEKKSGGRGRGTQPPQINMRKADE